MLGDHPVSFLFLETNMLETKHNFSLTAKKKKNPQKQTHNHKKIHESLNPYSQRK